MKRSSVAIMWALKHEGGYVNHPADPGGVTNFGISLRFLKGVEGADEWDLDDDGDVDGDDIKLLTPEVAMQIYEKFFWKPEMEQMLSPALAIKLFDMSINMGLKRATMIFQRSLNTFLKFQSPSTRLQFVSRRELAIDGVLGHDTLSVEALAIRAGLFAQVLDLICQEQARFYYDLANQKSSRVAFLLGWLRRAYAKPE